LSRPILARIYLFLTITRRLPRSTLFPYTTLFRSANTVASTDVAGIVELGKFVIASYVALAVMFIIHLVLVGAFGLNPFVFLKKVDRKSTRLNSSHVSISYAVFCLKKKKETKKSIQ